MTLAVQDFSPTGDSLVSGGFDAFTGLVLVVVVAGVALFAWLLVRNVRTLRRVGPGGRRSLAERLEELDDLHRRGVITAAEHAMARQRALTAP